MTFKAGDRVELVKPFRFSQDAPEWDEKCDQTLRRGVDRVVGTVEEGNVFYIKQPHDAVLVMFDDDKGYGRLAVDNDALAYEDPPVTDEEVAEAIQSILRRTSTSTPKPEEGT